MNWHAVNAIRDGNTGSTRADVANVIFAQSDVKAQKSGLFCEIFHGLAERCRVSPQHMAPPKQEENLSGESEMKRQDAKLHKVQKFQKVFASRSSSHLCVDITPSP